jgi:hypothetical protein
MREDTGPRGMSPARVSVPGATGRAAGVNPLFLGSDYRAPNSEQPATVAGNRWRRWNETRGSHPSLATGTHDGMQAILTRSDKRTRLLTEVLSPAALHEGESEWAAGGVQHIPA